MQRRGKITVVSPTEYLDLGKAGQAIETQRANFRGFGDDPDRQVLESTSDYDRGQKFQYYRALPSLREYLTGAQDVPHIEYRTRQPDDRWLLSDFRDLSQSIQLTSVDCVLSLAEVYDKVKWDA